MANWDSFDTSGNVEDRRGMTPSLIGGGWHCGAPSCARS